MSGDTSPDLLRQKKWVCSSDWPDRGSGGVVPVVKTIGASRWSWRFSPTPGQVDAHVDSVSSQFVFRADAGQHEQSWRLDRSGRDDDLVVRSRCLQIAGVREFDADTLVVLEEKAPCPPRTSAR